MCKLWYGVLNKRGEWFSERKPKRTEMKHEWKSGTGKKMMVEIIVDYTVDDSGKTRKTGPKQVFIKAEIDGQYVSHRGRIEPMEHPVAVACIGRLCMTPENYEIVKGMMDAAQAEVDAHNAAGIKMAAEKEAFGDGDINSLMARCGQPKSY